MNHLKFSQMLSSRLCHDLITPVSAVNTGIELLDDCNDQDWDDLLNISQHSAETALRRLVYYRAAFGYSTTNFITNFEELEKIITRFLLPIKIEFSWHDKLFLDDELRNAIDLPLFSRLVLNLILILTEPLYMGGKIHFEATTSGTHLEFIFKSTGKLTILRSEIQKAMAGLLPDKDQSPHTIQAYMTSLLLQEYDANIHYIQNNNSESTMRVTKKLYLSKVQQASSKITA